jgi:hypothetical protein
MKKTFSMHRISWLAATDGSGRRRRGIGLRQQQWRNEGTGIQMFHDAPFSSISNVPLMVLGPLENKGFRAGWNRESSEASFHDAVFSPSPARIASRCKKASTSNRISVISRGLLL